MQPPTSEFKFITILRRSLLVVGVGVLWPVWSADAPAVKTWEGTVTLPTYAWHDDVNPVFAELEGKIHYPYTRQDDIEHQSEERTYKALFLENEFLKVTCLPELGGRIHSVLDKTTGAEMFHKNDEIKPALIAMRGAWISGGIEWNVGPQGHTVTIVSPVDALLLNNEDGSATLVVGNTEKMFRTRWTVRLTLHPGKAYLDESIRIFNPTDGVHPYYFWNCTAFPNLPGTRFIYPMTLGCDHNGTSFFKWPVHEGKDLTWLKNYETMTSVFAYDCVFDFFGAYETGRDHGIVSYANHHELKGKKAWTWGKDGFGVNSQMSLSDAGPVDAQYIEVQSGPLLTQADYGMLKPRQDVSWREFWYPVHGLGDGFEYATRDVAAQTYRDARRLEVRLIATGRFPGARCSVARGDHVLADQAMDLTPAWAQSVVIGSPPEGPLTVTVRARDGSTLLAYDTPLAIPRVDPPDLTEVRARPDGESTVEELFRKAFLVDSQSDRSGARAGYERVLESDPGHLPSRCALAELDIELGRFQSAAAHARKAIERDPDHGEAWYLLGVSQLGRGAYNDAVRSGYKAAHAAETLARGYSLVGRARMRLGDYPEAVETFARAKQRNPEDSRNRDLWLLARLAAGDRVGVAEDATPLVARGDPTDFIPRALLAFATTGRADAFIEEVRAHAGEKVFTATETAVFFAEAGRFEEAAKILRALCGDGLPDPLPWYYQAYYQHKSGNESVAQATLRIARSKEADYAFPSRPEAERVLRYAVASDGKDGLAHLLLGDLRAALWRTDEAVASWERAVEIDPGLSQAWRLLGYHAWRKQNDLDRAETCYRKAIAARPDDQILLRDLARVLAGLDRRAEAIRMVEASLPRRSPRHDLSLWLARAYIADKRLDDCIAFLNSIDIKNPEGSSEPRDILVSALVARGVARYDAGQFEEARADFEMALTYPENLGVGQRYRRTDAETCYWLGKTLWASGRAERARAAWEEGAAQITSADPPLPSISVTARQDEHVLRCASALEVARSAR